jgi:capsular polysaccharide biosynthesis protein
MLRTRYTELVNNNDRARIMEQSTPRLNVTVLSPVGPAAPSNARDYVRLALAPAFSLVVGLGLAFFIDGLDNRMRTATDAETALELPVLASITERRRRRA